MIARLPFVHIHRTSVLAGDSAVRLVVELVEALSHLQAETQVLSVLEFQEVVQGIAMPDNVAFLDGLDHGGRLVGCSGPVGAGSSVLQVLGNQPGKLRPAIALWSTSLVQGLCQLESGWKVGVEVQVADVAGCGREGDIKMGEVDNVHGVNGKILLVPRLSTIVPICMLGVERDAIAVRQNRPEKKIVVLFSERIITVPEMAEQSRSTTPWTMASLPSAEWKKAVIL